MKNGKQTKRSTKSKRAVAKLPKVISTKQAVTVIGPLTAGALRDVLWETLNDVRTNQMPANKADAVAAQAREILRTVKTQVQIAATTQKPIPRDVIAFAQS